MMLASTRENTKSNIKMCLKNFDRLINPLYQGVQLTGVSFVFLGLPETFFTFVLDFMRVIRIKYFVSCQTLNKSEGLKQSQ